MSFREFLNEIQRTGSKTDREEYSGEKEFYRLKKHLKLLLSENGYNLYKYFDTLFLSKDDKYIAYLDGTNDKLNNKKSYYITVMHSEERGSMLKMFDMMKHLKYVYIVSDVLISDDALKFYEKIMKMKKYFAINYKDETTEIADDELLSNPDYRIVIAL